MYTTFQKILDMYPDKNILKNELITGSYSTLMPKWNCGSVVIKKLKDYFGILLEYKLIRRKADQKRVENGSAKRLKSKYRWLENLDINNLMQRVEHSNISDVAREIGCPHYVLRGHLERNGFVQDNFKRNKPSWNYGQTKETDSRIAIGAEKLSCTMKEKAEQGLINPPFHNKTTEEIKQSIDKALQTKLERFDGKYGPPNWAKGLTKETDSRIEKLAEKISKTRKEKIASGEINIWSAIKACHFEGTQIENLLFGELIKNNLNFKQQVLLFDKFLVDIVDKDNKISIFADGCFWHGCEKCNKGNFKGIKKRRQIDASQTAYLTKCGYRVFRFWEHDIKKDPKACAQQVADYINSTKA